MNRRSGIAARFWLGMFLPALLLAVMTIFIALVGGKGRGFAGIFVLIAAFVAVPGTMLANGWLLFVNWPPVRLVLAGIALPLVIAAVMAIWVRSPDGPARQGDAMMAPIVLLLKGAGAYPLASFLLWALAIAGLILAARRRYIRGEAAARTGP
ncbi:MAG: hypothetical protein IT529_18385 [Burkholderiales bacterium]|nr:hypothetical protein [Burkholderiales bacterium]